jgi:hypothetical protein
MLEHLGHRPRLSSLDLLVVPSHGLDNITVAVNAPGGEHIVVRARNLGKTLREKKQGSHQKKKVANRANGGDTVANQANGSAPVDMHWDHDWHDLAC